MLHALTRAFASARTVLLTAPSELDADAIGAIEALRRVLAVRWPSAVVQVVLDEAVPSSLTFLCDLNHFHDAARVPVGPVDLAVVLDGEPSRLAAAAAHVAAAQAVVMIDHHRTSADAAVALRLFDPQAASTTTLVAQLCDHWGVAFDAPIATAIYAGIAFDTGTFRYRNTTPATHRLAARLLEAGVDHTTVVERILLEQGEEKARLRGRVLTGLKKSPSGQVAWVALAAAECRGANTGGLVDELVFLRGVQLGVLIVEKAPGRVRISLRSRGAVDVAALARTLAPGGGGHAQAAGAMLTGSLRSVTREVVAAAEQAVSTSLIR